MFEFVEQGDSVMVEGFYLPRLRSSLKQFLVKSPRGLKLFLFREVRRVCNCALVLPMPRKES